MDHIHLGKPYKVTTHKHDQYVRHYEVPVKDCVLIPVRKYGDQISCDLLWKDAAGQSHYRDQLVFHGTCLLPLDAMQDYGLFDLWEDYAQGTPSP